MDPLTIASAAAQSIGNLFSGVMSYNADRAHAGALRQAALQSQMESGVNAQEALQQGDETMARAAVGGAANGGGLVGSTLGVISSLGDQAMFNARSAVYRGTTAAVMDNYNAKVADANADNSLIGSMFGAVGTAAAGWAKSSYQTQSMQALGRLRGLNSDTPYDYAYG